ncbi:hypothetical protein N7478_012974 [Penicillium angulare]|uniref:uncharacterized protein n=1 Tax=Penicillium angulare TaxID=116970 RepID=UPI00253F87A3|nr:uncharacterized protein N7478_012974 [Penicillium angulare]KAJ5256870.1 hypothetical protein N7478_012974 [Penicillium angulare]
MLYYGTLSQVANIQSRRIPGRATPEGGGLSDDPTDPSGLWRMPNVPELTRWIVNYCDGIGAREYRTGQGMMVFNLVGTEQNSLVSPESDIVSAILALYHRSEGTTDTVSHIFVHHIVASEAQRLQI